MNPNYKVREYPSLTAVEKETIINFSKEDDHMFIESYQSSVIRNLLKNDSFILIEQFTEKINDEKCICGISGKIPIGCLKIKNKARNSNNVSRIF